MRHLSLCFITHSVIRCLFSFQKYVEGEYIYIPKKECNRKHWGETTRSKEETSARNADIYKIYEEGTSVKSLSEMYYLSLKSIQKIVLKMKKENQ